jgi:nucleoid-associated protein
VANDIQGLIVHKFEKAMHAPGVIVPRADLVEITPAVQRLVDALHVLYGEKTGKGYGQFEGDQDTYPMQRRVREYFVDQRDNFLAFSLAAMNILKGKADAEGLATGGYVLITHISNGARDFMLFAIVTDIVGSAITADLNIEDSTHVDLNKFRVAGRIDLTSWNAGEERYIGFLKGTKAAVSTYFKHFLGCNDTIQPQVETRKLTAALKDFAQSNIPDEAERDAWLAAVFDTCTTLAKTNEPLSIDELSNAHWPRDPDVLKRALTANDLQMSDGYIPDRRSLKALVKFKASTRSWKLEFDRRAITLGDIAYIKDQGILTLRNLPDSLKQELDSEADPEDE